MAEPILYDTDILIDALRDIREAVLYLERAEQQGVLGISIVTQMELIVGCRNNAELRHLERFIERFVVVSLDATMAELGVDLLRQYRLSHGLLIPDALIAATALTLERPFATKNQRDYRFIAGLELLDYP